MSIRRGTRGGGGRERRLAGGFTLIELLVVVGIIGLLMAILLPALGRARLEAYKVVCGSQLRQWGSAVHNYAGDHNNQFPHGHTQQFAHLLTHFTVSDENRSQMMIFFEEYLTEQDIQAMLDGDMSITHCPLDEWGRRFEGDDRVLIGWQWLPGRESWHMNFGEFNTEGWVTKRQLDGPYASTPIMNDTWFTDEGHGSEETNFLIWETGAWGLPAGSRLGNHLNPREVRVDGQNHLFEDGSVAWYNAEEVEVGAQQGLRHKYFKIDIPGLADDY